MLEKSTHRPSQKKENTSSRYTIGNLVGADDDIHVNVLKTRCGVFTVNISHVEAPYNRGTHKNAYQIATFMNWQSLGEDP